MNEPLVSIIVPAYNAQAWLKDCCQSVLEQTYSNFELIIIDDGSVDGTLEIAQSFETQDSRVKVVHIENGGVCKARNRGLTLAQGEYIMFLDADDILLPDAILALYDELAAQKADIAVGQALSVSLDGTREFPHKLLPKELWCGTDGLVCALKDHPATYTVWGKLYKRKVLCDIWFTEGKRVHEDSFFFFECLLKKPTIAVCELLVIKYRHSENSASRAPFSDRVFDILYFAERKREKVLELFPEFEPLVYNMLIKANMALLHNLCKTNDRSYLPIEKQCIGRIISYRRYFLRTEYADQKWFWIITHRLYWIYKVCFRLRIKK